MYAIMIVEDEELIRQGLTSLVDYEQFEMTIINQAKNGREAWGEVSRATSRYPSNRYQYATNEWLGSGPSRQRAVSVLSYHFFDRL